MLFSIPPNIYLVPRRNNVLVVHPKHQFLKKAYRFSYSRNYTSFVETPLSIAVPKVVLEHVFSNKGLEGLGKLAFSKYSQKVILVTESCEAASYGVLLYDTDKNNEIGRTYSFIPSSLELAPDNFEFCVKLPPTEDFIRAFAKP